MRRITWGQYGGLKKELGDAKITVTTRFKGSGKKDLPAVVSQLDVLSFAHTDISERDPTLRLVREVRELRETLASIHRDVREATKQLPPPPAAP